MNDDLPGMLAVAKSVAEQKFPHTVDAAVWTAEFMKLHPDADEGAMLGWFANAIMAGYDTASARSATRPSTERDAALEEAAALCDQQAYDWFRAHEEGSEILVYEDKALHGVANLIRTLKGKP